MSSKVLHDLQANNFVYLPGDESLKEVCGVGGGVVLRVIVRVGVERC